MGALAKIVLNLLKALKGKIVPIVTTVVNWAISKGDVAIKWIIANWGKLAQWASNGWTAYEIIKEICKALGINW